MEGRVKLSLIVPVYRNESCIPDLLRALDDLNRQMAGDFEAVLVVDGSPDRCAQLLADALPRAGFDSQFLALSTNFGSFAAIRAGLAHATGDLFAVMAADLQEPPELVTQFREILQRGDHDVVVGTRRGRDDPIAKRLTSAIFWGLYRRFVQRQMPPGGIDVFACNKPFRDQLLELHESNTTLVGLILWMGFRRAEVPYDRRARQHGKSAWSFWRRVRYLLDSTFAFSDLPIRILSAAGTTGMLLAVVLMVIVLVAKLTHKIQVPGYTATVLTVMFFGGLNALGLGVLGEYVWRTFQNTKGRPNYIVANHKQFQKKETAA
jgi:glycosyltransferase involved in cell wall biosynthesis